MKNENEKKSLFARVTKKEKKSSCCCNVEIEEIPEEEDKKSVENKPKEKMTKSSINYKKCSL